MNQKGDERNRIYTLPEIKATMSKRFVLRTGLCLQENEIRVWVAGKKKLTG